MTNPEQIVGLPGKNERSEVVILADGTYPSAEISASLLRNARRVVCCDGAAVEYVARGGVPNAVVGDCDSLSHEFKEIFAPILFCDSDQETNDLTKAVNHCVGNGWKDITILGATGKREDHTLGNISLLTDYMEYATVRMVSDIGVFTPIKSDTFFDSFPGQQMSVFTLSPATLITTYDLLYPLKDASLRIWWQGTLNQSLGDKFGVGTTGPAIVYRLL